jgi:hypothetical protein
MSYLGNQELAAFDSAAQTSEAQVVETSVPPSGQVSIQSDDYAVRIDLLEKQLASLTAKAEKKQSALLEDSPPVPVLSSQQTGLNRESIQILDYCADSAQIPSHGPDTAHVPMSERRTLAVPIPLVDYKEPFMTLRQ